MSRRVVKLGGSVLRAGQIGPTLKVWLEENDDLQNIIVVGGGSFADVVRELQGLQNLGEQQSHELACHAMSLNAKVVSCLIPEAEFCDRISQLENSQSSNIIFDAAQWTIGKSDIPASWDFTSDSIAARLASELDAAELVLIKSRMGSIGEPGFVDAHFTKEARSVKSVRVCTLNA
ncbi:amino acid kinase family protein [Mariniblastus fucicola]|uniref:Amino acid kinase family protein n=1 Tax=Mariniblastus fucicola TaxID=980251 RepID=A0A5B9P4Q8_9BACT|nr:hypothetical protein [Mariniblastus fucicola]QEG21378.1 Amino acid kinase family protein [Mariniblastus fucicola]